MAVLPELQRKGSGAALIAGGSRELGKSGCSVVVVLRHAGHHPKFGSAPARRDRLEKQWMCTSDEVFMARFLKPEKANLACVTVSYRKVFDMAAQGADGQEMER
jgi:predicted N-acetyltransferase YhbS